MHRTTEYIIYVILGCLQLPEASVMKAARAGSQTTLPRIPGHSHVNAQPAAPMALHGNDCVGRTLGYTIQNT